MGILTDFFLASISDVSRVLSGWQLPPPPLPQAVVFEIINPFTRQPLQVTTRRDRSNEPEPDPEADPSPDVSSLPNVQCKGLLPDKLAPAFATLADVTADVALDLILCGALTGPPDTEISVLLLPLEFTVALASASEQDLARAAQAFVDGDATSRPGDASVLAGIFREVRGLAAQGQADGARLFLWICP